MLIGLGGRDLSNMWEDFARIVVNEKCEKGRWGSTFFRNVRENLSA
jgi:hypothetical protein